MKNGRVTIKDIENFETILYSGESRQSAKHKLLSRIDYVRLKYFLDFPIFLKNSISNLELCLYPVDNLTIFEKFFYYSAVEYASSIGEQGKFVGFLNELASSNDDEVPEIYSLFLKALQTVFGITKEQFSLWVNSLKKVCLECSLKLQTISFIKNDEKGYEIWNAIELDVKKNEDFVKGINLAREKCDDYLFNTYEQVNEKGLSEALSLFDKYSDSPLCSFFKKYYSGICNIYSLDLKNINKFDAEKYLSQIFDAHNSSLYMLGREYKRFLPLCVSAEIFLHNKISTNAKAYFDFGINIGVFSKNDEENILNVDKAKEDFFKYFLPFKFNLRDNAILVFKDATYPSELIEPYLRGKVKKAESKKSLIDDIFEYRSARYGFSLDFRANRAKLLFDLQEKLQTSFLDISLKQEPTSKVFNPEMMGKFDNRFKSSYEAFVDKYMTIIPEASDTVNAELEDQAKNLKEIILESANKCKKEDIISSYHKDIFRNISPLRLAIDSFDSEIVRKMISCLDVKDLSSISIYNGKTALQYALYKYDIFMQDLENVNRGKTRRPVTEHQVPYFIDKDNDFSVSGEFYKKQSVTEIVRTFPWEENGFIFHPTYARELVQIIYSIASKVGIVNSQDLYHLLVQQDPRDGQTFSDSIDIAKHLCENCKLVLTGGEDIESLADTVITYSTRTENYSFLKFLLTCNNPAIKDVINEKVVSSSAGGFSEETAFSTFVNLQIDALKIASKDMAHSGSVYDDAIGKLRTFIPLFKEAGARDDIKDANGLSVCDILKNNKEILKDIQDVL